MLNNQAILEGQDIPAILPTEKTQALQSLIKLTQKLVDIAEREAQALAQNDMLSFAVMQDEKTLIAEHYAKASEEFRGRLAQFRGASPALLDRLEALQNRLGMLSRQNNDSVTNIYETSRQNTQATLLAAQEMGQNTKITFANNNEFETQKEE